MEDKYIKLSAALADGHFDTLVFVGPTRFTRFTFVLGSVSLCKDEVVFYVDVGYVGGVDHGN